MTTPSSLPHRLPPLPGETYRCDLCGFDFASAHPDEALTRIDDALAELRPIVTEMPSAAWAIRPEEQTWSVAEYVCHLRDVAMTSTLRLHRIRVEDVPALEPMYNDVRARRFRYRDADVVAALAEFDAAAAGLRDEVARVTPDAWSRIGERLAGERRTALWVVRNAAHEAVHHLADVRRIAQAVT